MARKKHARRESRKLAGKKFGTTTYRVGGKAKLQAGGPMKQGYNARLGWIIRRKQDPLE